MLTFVMLPSTATLIFKAFLCDDFEYSEAEVRQFLHDDLSLSCAGEVYSEMHRTAVIMIFVWPYPPLEF
eukprot:2137042-Prymnesium_polylepis.2